MSGGNSVHIQEHEQNSLVAVFRTVFKENSKVSPAHLFSSVTAANIGAARQLAAFPFTNLNAGHLRLCIVEILGLQFSKLKARLCFGAEVE